MGGASSISSQVQANVKQTKLISFYNMDLHESQSHQSMRLSEETTINDIITYIKERQGGQNIELYYEKIRVAEQPFLIYEYIDLLPTRIFGFRINSSQKQLPQQNTKLVQNDKQQIQNNYTQSQITINQKKSQSEQNEKSDQKQQNRNPQNNNNNSSLSQKNQHSAIKFLEISESNQNQTENKGDNELQIQQDILPYLLKQAIFKQQKNKNEIEQLKLENNQLKQEISELQLKNKNLEDSFKQFNQQNNYDSLISTTISKSNILLKQVPMQKNSQIEIKKKNQIIDNNKNEEEQQLKNQCGHYLNEQNIQNILRDALINKTIAYCDQCKPKLSSNILIKMDVIGKTYKEIQAILEINQLLIKLKQQKKHLIYQCSNSGWNQNGKSKLLLSHMFAQQQDVGKQQNKMKFLQKVSKIQLIIIKLNIKNQNLKIVSRRI